MAFKCIPCSRLHHERVPPAHHTAPGVRHALAAALPHDFQVDNLAHVWNALVFLPYSGFKNSGTNKS
jgi:hypothetical protein